MENQSSRETEVVNVTDVAELVREAARFKRRAAVSRPPQIPAYRLALGLEPISLGQVEFEILLLLASRPYHPFTRRDIVEGVYYGRAAVSLETVDRFIGSLRDQLGVFHDYVQTVPYIGYRFKP